MELYDDWLHGAVLEDDSHGTTTQYSPDGSSDEDGLDDMQRWKLK